MDLPSSLEDVVKWTAVAFGAVGAAFGLHRRASGDRLAVTKNQSQGNWIEDLKRERDEAVSREREHLKRIGSLEMRNALMVERMERMDHELARIKRLLIEARPDLATLLNSDFSPLPDPHPEEPDGLP